MVSNGNDQPAVFGHEYIHPRSEPDETEPLAALIFIVGFCPAYDPPRYEARDLLDHYLVPPVIDQ